MTTLLLKVARAQARGALPANLFLSGSTRNLEIREETPPVGVDPPGVLERWVRREFPDAGAPRVENTFRQQGKNRRPARRLDRMRYRSSLLVAVYYRVHEHSGEYKADTRDRDRHGNVPWSYVCCSEPVGVKAARELGLTA